MPKEKDLQNEVVAMLQKIGIKPLVHRTDKRSTATIGWPDITFACHGRAVAWELKLPKGKTSLAQQKMHKILSGEPNGWKVNVIHSRNEALSALNNLLM